MRMGEKGDLNDIERYMVVGWTCLSAETADLSSSLPVCRLPSAACLLSASKGLLQRHSGTGSTLPVGLKPDGVLWL